ncbi:MAG: hypothetical protein AAB478_02735 [Patescibacteria group bacterium]
MWSGKRVLKKNKKNLTKKRILFISVLSGLAGLILVVTGLIVMRHEPAFISPLPFLKFRTEASDQSKAITKMLEEKGIHPQQVVSAGGSIYKIELSDQSTVYINGAKDLPEQISSLQRIASRLTMEGKKFLRLDLRYAKPVIVLK